jgi:hypothetical protein
MIMLTADSIATHGNHMKKKEDRQVSLEIPVYIRTAARKGLDYYGQGLAGEGLVDRTVREARDMARGDISEDKVIRSNAWAQRHAVDLDAPKNSDADNDEFPGAGAVAHYLWGINPLNPQPARDWFERKANQIKDERGLFSFHRAKTEYFANIPGMEDNKVETRRIMSTSLNFAQVQQVTECHSQVTQQSSTRTPNRCRSSSESHQVHSVNR